MIDNNAKSFFWAKSPLPADASLFYDTNPVVVALAFVFERHIALLDRTISRQHLPKHVEINMSYATNLINKLKRDFS